ncbi:MAG: glycosyltransferase family 39 protein [Burkholderiales bacterium]|nr:glycosyltransferase family 39 protein [Burkholderiales bacterium]
MKGIPRIPAALTGRRQVSVGGVILLAIFLALWFGGLDHRRLVEPDEGRYAEVAREMLAAGDFVTPRLNGFKHFTKPPMQYWMTALAFHLFGVNEWAARLWPALAGMLALLVVMFTMRRLFGAAAGISSAAVLGSSLYFTFFAQVGTIDMGLTLFVTTAMCALMLGLDATPDSARERNAMLAAWAAMALAVLSKGLIGVVFPLMAAALYAISQSQWSMWRRLHPFTGACVLFALAAPWFIAVSLRNPEFLRFFLVDEHFARYTSSIHRRTQPMWFFLPLIVVGMMPWAWVALSGVRAAWRAPSPAGTPFRPARFLLIWAASIIVFFTFSRAKMPAYVLPAIPALGMLAGMCIADLDARATRRRVLPLLAAMGAAILVAAVLLPHSHAAQPYRVLFDRYATWLYGAGFTALLGSALIGALRPSGPRLIGGIAVAGLITIQLCVLGFESLSPLRSSHALARQIAARTQPDTRVFMVGASYLALPFYLGRTVVLAQETGQMAFGVRLEPERALLDAGRFRAAWAEAPSAIAVMDHRTYDDARAAGMPMQVLCRDRERVLTIKPAGTAQADTGPVPDCVLQAAGE